MSRGTALLAAAIALPLLASLTFAAQVNQGDEPTPVWLVELAPGADASALEAASRGLDHTVRHHFERVYGDSVEADPATARRLERLDIVEQAWSTSSPPGPPASPTS